MQLYYKVFQTLNIYAKVYPKNLRPKNENLQNQFMILAGFLPRIAGIHNQEQK